MKNRECWEYDKKRLQFLTVQGGLRFEQIPEGSEAASQKGIID